MYTHYNYGFELEGFYYDPKVKGIGLPPESYPTDGFPGLIEIRTDGHGELYKMFGELLAKAIPYHDIVLDSSYAFTAAQRRELRKRTWEKKTGEDIRNIYGKNPRSLKGRTIASFQINVSNCLREAYRDCDGDSHADVFSLLDIPRIVVALDKEFKSEIDSSRRQPGEYCIKGDRLEYRSLPNSVCPLGESLSNQKFFLERIKKAVEG